MFNVALQKAYIRAENAQESLGRASLQPVVHVLDSRILVDVHCRYMAPPQASLMKNFAQCCEEKMM
jgi:hypothetical protein